MITYSDGVVLRNDGVDPSTLAKDLNAAVATPVTVRIASLPTPGQGAIASIFDINSSPISNPFNTDDNGNFTFKAASGFYDVIVDEGGMNIIDPSVDMFGGETTQDLSLTYEFATVAAFKASLIEFPDDKTIRLLDRGADFTKISGTGTANEFNIIASTSISQSIDLIIKDRAILTQFGAIADNGVTDNSAASVVAMTEASARKIPIVYSGGGTFVLQSFAAGEDYYVDWLPDVSIIVEPGTVVKAGTALNSGVTKLRGMFVQADVNKPLGNVSLTGDFDMNGANNLVGAADFTGTKNAVGLILSATTVVIDVSIVNSAGRQCLSIGEAAGLIGTVILKRFDCKNVGAGLAGNNEQTDHSNIYCVADDFTVISASCVNEQEPPHVVTAIESHAVRTTITNLHTNDNVSISFILAAIEQNIESASIDASVCKGDMFFEPFTSGARTIGTVSIGDSNKFTKTFGVLSCIDLSSQMIGSGGSISVGAMTFDNVKSTNDSVTPVILLGRWRKTVIGKCIVNNADARFIQTGTIISNNSSLYVDGPVTENTNKNSTAGFNQLIRLFGANSLATVDIKNISADPKAGASFATIGVQIECPVSVKCLLLDNELAGNITIDYTNNTSAAGASAFFIRHRGNQIPAGGIKAQAGSSFLVDGVDRYELEVDGTAWLRKPIANRTLGGSPVGALLPFSIGEEVLNTAGNTWFKAYGLNNVDWQAL